MATKPKQDKPKGSHISPEGREKLARLARERHEAGQLGGAQFGRKGGLATAAKRTRAAQSIAEAAQDPENAKAMVQVLKDAIDPSQPIAVRMKGVTEWTNIERNEGKLSLIEAEADERKYGREELLKILTEKLTTGGTADAVRNALMAQSSEVVVDAEVVDGDDV